MFPFKLPVSLKRLKADWIPAEYALTIAVSLLPPNGAWTDSPNIKLAALAGRKANVRRNAMKGFIICGLSSDAIELTNQRVDVRIHLFGDAVVQREMFRKRAKESHTESQSPRQSVSPAPRKPEQVKVATNLLELCDKGDVTLLKQFAKNNAQQIYSSLNTPTDDFGNTALHHSVSQGDAVLSFLLLLKGV